MPDPTWRTLWDEAVPAAGGRAQARWVCEEASGVVGDEFGEILDQPPTARMLAHLDSMLGRLRSGEPLQYVLGHWAFRHLDLMVDRRVLIPRPETELVAEVAIAAAATMLDEGGSVVRCVDLGTGSGAIGLSIAFELPRGRSEVWVTDASTDALDVARANVAGLGIAGGGVRFAQGSWYEALPAELLGSVDLMVANPPYVADGDDALEQSVRDWEPHGALFAGGDGLADIRIIVEGSRRWLRPGGVLVLEIGEDQGEAVLALLDAAGLVQPEVRNDLAGRPRIAIAAAP